MKILELIVGAPHILDDELHSLLNMHILKEGMSVDPIPFGKLYCEPLDVTWLIIGRDSRNKGLYSITDFSLHKVDFEYTPFEVFEKINNKFGKTSLQYIRDFKTNYPASIHYHANRSDGGDKSRETRKIYVEENELEHYTNSIKLKFHI